MSQGRELDRSGRLWDRSNVKNIISLIVLASLVILAPANAFAESAAKAPTAKQLRKQAKKLRKEGQSLAKKSQYDQALAVYAKALETYQAYPMVYNEIGVIHFLQGDLVQAAASFRKALSLYPDLSVAWANLAEVDRKRERYNDSANHYKEFVSRRPNVADGFYGLALALMAQDKKEGALWAMKRFVALEKRADPQKIAEVQARVTLLEQEGVQAKDVLRVEEAIAAVKKRKQEAKAKKKERVKAHKGDQYYASEQYIPALAAYKLQLKKRKKTKDPSLHYKIGATYAALRDYRAAMNWWGKALAMAPKRKIIFEHMVLAAVQAAKVGQLDLGEPGNAEDRQKKAAAALASGKPALALAWLVEPTNDAATYLRGKAALAGGNLRLAKKCFESLHAAHSEDVEIATALAQTLFRLKRANDAMGIVAKVPALKEMDEQALLLRETVSLPSSLAIAPGTMPASDEGAAEKPNKPADQASPSNEPEGVDASPVEPVEPKKQDIASEPATSPVDVDKSAGAGESKTKVGNEPPTDRVKAKPAPKKAKKKAKRKAKKPRKPVKAKAKKAKRTKRKAKRAKKKRKKKAALEDDDL